MSWLTAEQKVMLEVGQSPDELLINPPRKSPVNLEPGHYSSRQPIIKDRRVVGYRIEWYTIRAGHDASR